MSSPTLSDVLMTLGCSPGITVSSDDTAAAVADDDATLHSLRHDMPMSRGVRLAKTDFGSVFGSLLKKNCGFRFVFTKLTAVSVFGSVFWTVCCLMCMPLEMTYFHAELVQLIVNQSYSELEVQIGLRQEEKYFDC